MKRINWRVYHFRNKRYGLRKSLNGTGIQIYDLDNPLNVRFVINHKDLQGFLREFKDLKKVCDREFIKMVRSGFNE